MKQMNEGEKLAQHINRGIKGTQWLIIGIMFVIAFFALQIIGLSAVASFLVLAAAGGLYALAEK